MPRRPRWERFLSEISEWDQRFERDRAPWIELAAGLAALTIVVVSFLAAVDGDRTARSSFRPASPCCNRDRTSAGTVAGAVACAPAARASSQAARRSVKGSY